MHAHSCQISRQIFSAEQHVSVSACSISRAAAADRVPAVCCTERPLGPWTLSPRGFFGLFVFPFPL